MSATLDALPGTPTRVSEIIPSLARHWQEAAQSGASSRAAQMNLVVVFGSSVTPEAAREQLENAFMLARRYPCRTIVLCPDSAPDAKLEARLDLSCFTGPDGRDQRCGEALMLGFPADITPEILVSQVSVWLESDLPGYVWLHGVSADETVRLLPLLPGMRRVVYDSSVCSGDFSKVTWPKPEVVRDLACARLLPVRQALGQFLSAYKPEALATGLRNIVVRHATRRRGEARHLSAWMRAGLDEVSRRTKIPLTATFSSEEKNDGASCLSTEWSYSGGGALKWEHASKGSGATIEADIAGVKYGHPMRVPFLDQPAALAEALFF